MNIDISTLKFRYLLIGIVWFLSIFLPGYLFLYIFRVDFFYYMNIFTLSMLALTVTSPLLFFNLVSFLLIYKQNPNADARFSNALFKSELITSFMLYVSIIVGFTFDLHMPMGVGIVIFLEFLLGIYTLKQLYNHSKTDRGL